MQYLRSVCNKKRKILMACKSKGPVRWFDYEDKE